MMESASRSVIRRKTWIVIAAAFAALAFASPAVAGIFQVNSAADTTTPVGTLNCDPGTQTGTPSCTLRDAIGLANLDTGGNTIGFHIAGSGVQSIALASPRPAVLTKTTIDGTTQTGYAGSPLIVLDGTALTSGAGLELDGAGGGVSGLDFVNFGGGSTALYLHGGGATVTANYVGVDSTGAAQAANQIGIQVDSANNTIGGTTAAARNVISGNLLGISITGLTATGNIVKGNFIGPIANDTSAIGNDIAVELGAGAENNTIGSVGAGANVLAGSSDVAILVNGGTNNAISGNFVGTDLGGSLFALANDEGVRILTGSGNTFSHNRISTSNTYGVELGGGANTFTANRIDSNVGGGIIVDAGGSTIGPGNTIVDNQSFGVRVAVGNGTRITQNAIDGTNGGLGIDLSSGANNDQVAPALTVAAGSGTGTSIEIQGTLDSTASTSFAVEFFRSPSCHDSTESGKGEGAAYLGTALATTDGLGHVSFDQSFPALGNGTTITATATDAAGNTSEFSGCVTMSPAAASVFTVTANDNGTSGPCTISHCSLWEAIDAANNTPGTDAIVFDISPGGLKTIKPSAGLPAISDPVSIDGTTQPGTPVGSPGIELDGSAVDGSANGLEIDAGGGGSTVRGLVINRFNEAGILLNDAGNTVAGNYVGTDATGTDNAANVTGIVVFSGGNVIGGSTAADRNVISGNTSGGIHLTADGNTIEGNYIGTDATGSAAIGNGDEGILVQAQNTTIGGTAAGAGNVISGTTAVTSGHGDGVGLYGANNFVQGNLIGTNATGTGALPNAKRGVLVNGANGNEVGGTTASARNVLSGNGEAGVEVINGGSNNKIEGNDVGVQADGSTPLANVQGIEVAGGSGNFIGGTAAGAGNVVSSNLAIGVVVNFGASSTTVQGNHIGTDSSGTLARGNGDSGLLVDATDTTIGGIAAGAANTIAFNGIDGIEVNSGTGNSIRGNSIFSNSGEPLAGLGIDLGGDYVTLNDTGDADTGANNLQNFPVISAATTGGGHLSIAGSLNSSATTTYDLDIFASAACDVSGYGEGQTFLGTFPVTTDGSGNRAFAASSFPSVPAGESITATATDPGGNTSEFSACATVTGAAQPGPTYTVNTSDDHNDGVCSVDDCTLREAINAANGDGVLSAIHFALPASTTITPGSDLPQITAPVDIDATTQTGYSGTPLVVLDGSNSEGNGDGLRLAGGGSTVRGFELVNWSDAAIFVLQNDGNTIAGNLIGVDAGGAAAANGEGVIIRETSNGNTIGGVNSGDRNVISGNSQYGIDISASDSGSTNNVVVGNFIGLARDGSTGVGNGSGGIIVVAGTDNTIGGTTAAARNVISGNDGDGILLQGGSNIVKGNTIGLAAASDTAVPNTGSGVNVDSGGATANTIGDTSGGGNVISGNEKDGILLSQLTANPGTVIAGNHIGTNPAGTTPIANGGDGIDFNDGAFVTVNANTISGNESDGIYIFGFDSHDNLIEHNKIGTNDAGTAGIANGFDGVQVDESSPNTIDMNVVSGNGSIGAENGNIGIEIDGPNPEGASGNVVTGNLVGLNAAGTAAIGNLGDGIRIGGVTDTTIGGATAGARNVVSGNGGHGIHLGSADSNTVQGNYAGLNGVGTAALPNGLDGIAVDDSSSNAITGNVASGNQNQGISIFNVGGATTPNENTVKGNRTGLAATGTAFVQNGGDGIRVFDGTNTTIGGVAAGEGNESAGNGKNGVVIIGAVSTGNAIRGNSIHDNGTLGIDLSATVNPTDGVTPNDPGDGDTGANNLQNFPVLTSATVNGGSTRIIGSLDTALGTYTIDYYANTTCDASGHGEGARWLGFSVLKTGAGGTITIDTGAGITAPVTVGEAITATATDTAGNTSEFSSCMIAQGALAGLGLTADEASAPAGAANVPLASVPPATLGLLAGAPIPNSPIPNSPVGAAPIPNSPIPNSPIPNSPIANSPIANSPIANSGVDGIPTAILATIPLSSIPIDWTPIFAGTPEANVPTPSLTLLDVFNEPTALQKFNALSLSQLHLEGSLLRGVRFSSLLYGGITLDKIPPYSQGAWCALLSSCTGIDVTKVTVLGLDVAGLFDATSLGGVTVGQVHDVTPPGSPIPNSPIPNSPIPNSPIANSPIANSSVPLTAIGSVVIGTLAVPSNVVDCTKLASCLTKTLAAAANANAIKPTATYQDLLRPNSSGQSPLANVNFNEFAIAMIGIANLPWESWPFDGFQEFAGTGSVVHYHLTAPVPCNTAYTLRAILPHGFLVKRGTSTLEVGLGAASPVADPTTDPVTGASWALPAVQCVGTQPVRLNFQGLPGFRLGEQTAAAQLIIGTTTQAANDQAPVTVTQNNEPDSDPATAPAIQPDTLAIGHIPTSGDIDWRSLSTTGMPRGTKITVYLRPPAGTDLDLYLTKPTSPTLLSSPIANSPIPNSPIPNSPLPDNGGSLGATTNNPQPEGLQDAPIPNSSIASAGITRGDGVEVAQVVLSGDENGPVKILVAGYNGARSADAYTLRVKVVTPLQLPACPARSFAFPNVTNQGTLLASIPSTTQNLFVMNFGATAKTYGLTAANSLLAKLNAIAARTDVKGAVLQVDGDASVRTAKATWDASPCSVTAANDVVRKINAVVARYRGQATGVQSLTIVGGDELVPMARISDLTTDANEATAVGDLVFTTNGLTRANALFASEFLGNTLTDDAYTAGTTIPWFGRELYLPQIAGGRLVETPAEIMGQLDQYTASNGILAPTTAVVSGYDFMKDEATQISTELRSTTARTVLVDTTSPARTLPLIGDTWTATDLQPYFTSSTASRGIVSANGHYNHWEAAPASPLPLTSANLIPTSLLPLLGATQLQDSGSILFTMGCHAGLNVSDTFPSGTTPERLRDWAQALSQNKVAVYVANTGYGYGDFDAIALSERLMTMFAHNLASDGSIGRKLVLAKQQYFGSIASYDPYAEKALAEATFYGLPFYRVGTGAEQASPPPVSTIVDPSGTGVRVGVIPAINPALTPHTTARGRYWSNTADGGVEYLKDRPIEPRLSQEVTTNGGLRAHGVRITELWTHDVLNVDPLIATPMIDLSAHEPEALVKNITFPATFAAIDHWTAFGANHDSLVVDAGQTRPGTGPGETQRLVDHIKLDVLYSASTDFAPPLLYQVGSVVNGGTATLFAHTSDPGSPVARVVAFYTEGGAVWKFVTLTRVGTSDLYTGTAAVTVPEIESAFFSQDAAGNVGYTTDKGTLFTSLTGDTQPPEVTIAAPIDNAVYAPGQSVPASFACSDDGGVSACTGTVANGTNVDTSSLGPKSFSVTTTDLSGNIVTVTVHYSVAYTFGGFLSPIHNLPDLNVVNPGSTVPIKFTLNGNQGLSIFAVGSPSSQAINCNATVPLDPVTTMPAGGSTLTYDSKTGIYTYAWKTDSTWTGCRQLIVKLKDGTTHLANFKFSSK